MTKCYIINLGRMGPTDSTLTIENELGTKFEGLIESLEWKLLSKISNWKYPTLVTKNDVNFDLAEFIFKYFQMCEDNIIGD